MVTTEEIAIHSADISLGGHKEYGNYQAMKYEKTMKIGDYEMKVYSGHGYEETGGLYSKKYFSTVQLLTYKMTNGTILSVKIEGNNVPINDDLIKEIISFEILDEKEG